jgi:hypothetical protein
MTQYQRSMQVWSILVLSAINQKLISYETISKLIGVPTPGIGRFLFPILNFCQQNRLPPLTSIVISHVTGRPGEGFPEELNIVESQSSVFVYNWLSREAPDAEQLQASNERNAN